MRLEMRAGALLAMVLICFGCAATPLPATQPPAPASSNHIAATPSATLTATPTSPPIATSTPNLPATPAPTMPPAIEIAAALAAPGTLTACLSVVGPPATGLTGEGQLVGYNVSIAAEIATRLNLELETQEPLFDDLIDRIQDHDCDLSVSNQNITTARLSLVDFLAYSESLQPVLVQIDNPHEINALTDLCGQPVSATKGTTHVDLVNGTGEFVGQGLNEGCVAADRAPIDLQTHETESHAITALLQGTVIAYLGNPSYAFEFADQIEYSDATLPPARQGITTARDRPVLQAAVAPTLAAMIADGTYRAILTQHLPNDESVKVVSIVE